MWPRCMDADDADTTDPHGKIEGWSLDVRAGGGERGSAEPMSGR